MQQWNNTVRDDDVINQWNKSRKEKSTTQVTFISILCQSINNLLSLWKNHSGTRPYLLTQLNFFKNRQLTRPILLWILSDFRLSGKYKMATTGSAYEITHRSDYLEPTCQQRNSDNLPLFSYQCYTTRVLPTLSNILNAWSIYIYWIVDTVGTIVQLCSGIQKTKVKLSEFRCYHVTCCYLL